jgi:hypothetical protein
MEIVRIISYSSIEELSYLLGVKTSKQDKRTFLRNMNASIKITGEVGVLFNVLLMIG